MEIDKPCLFLEINDKNFIFVVAQYDKDLNYKILDTKEVQSEGVLNGKIIDITITSKILKDSIVLIEKKINFTFKSAIVVSCQNSFECINISGYKKLAGRQIFDEDISYILNDIKKIITDNNPQKSLVHLFNSNFILDEVILEKLPTGLHGEFYNQHLTFFLFPKHEIKNIQLALKSCNINISRIIFKEFVYGIKKLNTKELSVLINIQEEKINLSMFDNSSLIFSEYFNFGSNLIIRDISKICSLDIKVVKQIFSDNYFKKKQSLKNSEYLDIKYFEENRSRQISRTHLMDIIIARVDEIMEKIYKKNINLAHLKNNKKNVHINLEDFDVFTNLSDELKAGIDNNLDNIVIDCIKSEDERLLPVISAVELAVKGWEKEAIPIVKTKKSIISRLFSIFFK
jgi:cell division protein FtsA